jgi:L-lactate dehydrogenase complex protein LldG
LESVNTIFNQIPDLQHGIEYVAKIAINRNAKRIVVSNEALLSKLREEMVAAGRFHVASGNTSSRTDFYESLKNAEIGVSSVDLAVAESGTLVILTSDEESRLVTALPEVHVAIVPRSKLVESLAEAAPYLSKAFENTTGAIAVSLISASSRTSDIGDMVILGVHGPKELHVLLLD